MSFHGEVALVTGAASGMGRLAAERLAESGAKVAALDVDEEGLRQLASGRDGVRAWPVDVANPQAVDAAVAEAERELGPLDRVVNAAAILRTNLMLETDRELYHRMMAINYGGTVNVTLATLPGMLERGRGDLINFASMAGWLPAPHFGAYTATKFAVVGFTETLAYENRKRGVRFCCVCPPPVDTPLLDGAVSKPKILEQMPPLQPAVVLDAVERAIDRGELFVFPGRGTRAGWRARRFVPGLVWRRLLRLESL